MEFERVKVDAADTILGCDDMAAELEIVAKWTKQVDFSDDEFEQFVRDQVKDLDIFLHFEKNTMEIRMIELCNRISGRSMGFFENY